MREERYEESRCTYLEDALRQRCHVAKEGLEEYAG